MVRNNPDEDDILEFIAHLKNNPLEAIYDPDDDNLKSFELEMLIIVVTSTFDTTIRYFEFDAKMLSEKCSMLSVEQVLWAFHDVDEMFESCFYRNYENRSSEREYRILQTNYPGGIQHIEITN